MTVVFSPDYKDRYNSVCMHTHTADKARQSSVRDAVCGDRRSRGPVTRLKPRAKYAGTGQRPDRGTRGDMAQTIRCCCREGLFQQRAGHMELPNKLDRPQ